MSDDQIRAANNIVSEPDELVDHVAALENAGVTRVILASKVGDFRATVDAVADGLLPAFA
jgi:purine nucleoside phosphorylase